MNIQTKINLFLLVAVVFLSIGHISENKFSNDIHTVISEINKSQTEAIAEHTKAITLLTEQNKRLANRIEWLEEDISSLKRKGENNE